MQKLTRDSVDHAALFCPPPGTLVRAHVARFTGPAVSVAPAPVEPPAGPGRCAPLFATLSAALCASWQLTCVPDPSGDHWRTIN